MRDPEYLIGTETGLFIARSPIQSAS